MISKLIKSEFGDIVVEKFSDSSSIFFVTSPLSGMMIDKSHKDYDYWLKFLTS